MREPSPTMQPAPHSRDPEPPRPSAVAPDVEAVLRDSAALWEAVQRTSGEYIAVVDREGVIRGCNRVDDGFAVDDVIGQSFVRFTEPESTAAITNALHAVFAAGVTSSIETTVRRLDGSLSFFSLRIAPIQSGGRTVAALACCENIRPLKTSERALEHERNVLRRLLEIQERERQLVSYEIHDGLAQYLAGAVMHFQASAHAQGTLATTHDFEDGMRLLQAAVVESRRLIGGLRPPALDELGIVDAIESLVADARTDIPRVTFHHALAGHRLPPQLETVIFRVVQEALTNARKYADAGEITVALEETDGCVMVLVKDDGKGFDPRAVPEERFGLEGIRQRCRLLGGEPRITSAPGAGTTIEATLPIPAAE